MRVNWSKAISLSLSVLCITIRNEMRAEGPLSQGQAVIFQSHPYLTGRTDRQTWHNNSCFRLGSGAEGTDTERLGVIFGSDKRVIVSPCPPAPVFMTMHVCAAAADEVKVDAARDRLSYVSS